MNKLGTFLTIYCENISFSILNISNIKNQIHDFFIYTPIAIDNLNMLNLTNEESLNYILIDVNCSLNLSNSFLSRISNKFLLLFTIIFSVMKQILQVMESQYKCKVDFRFRIAHLFQCLKKIQDQYLLIIIKLNYINGK